jgi:hypothetical protein
MGENESEKETRREREDKMTARKRQRRVAPRCPGRCRNRHRRQRSLSRGLLLRLPMAAREGQGWHRGAIEPLPITCGKCSSSSESPRVTSLHRSCLSPGYDGAGRASALSNSRAPAAAKARRAIQLAIHWPVMTINPGGCALKRTRPSVIVMSGMPRQPCQPFDQE